MIKLMILIIFFLFLNKEFVFAKSGSIEERNIGHDDEHGSKEKHDDHDEHGSKEKHDDHDEHGSKEKHDDHDEHGSKEKRDDHDEHGSKEKHDDHDEHGSKEKHDDHDEHESEKFGDHKAIQRVENDGMRFMLSAEAIKQLDIKSQTVKPIKRGKKIILSVPSTSLVFSREDVGIFLVEGSWFHYTAVDIFKKEGMNTLVTISKLLPRIEVVTKGVPLLRVAHLEAMGKGGKGHVH